VSRGGTVSANIDGAAQIKNNVINWMRLEQGYFINGGENLSDGKPSVFQNRSAKNIEHSKMIFQIPSGKNHWTD
jgi:hypothetical protein